MTKSYIPTQYRFVQDDMRVETNFDNAAECFMNLMTNMVEMWYSRLTNDAQTAIKLMRFNPTVVTSMMFFTDGSLDEESQYFGYYYDIFAREMSNFAVYLSHCEEDYQKSQERFNGHKWHSRMAQGVRMYEKAVREAEKLHEYTLSILDGDLKDKVVSKIIAHDPACQLAARLYYEALEEGRKNFLSEAIRRMKG